MRKTLMLMAAILMLGVITCSVSYSQYNTGKKEPVNVGNSVCPVMGTSVVPGKSLTVEYDGKIYNVCCQVCVKTFNSDPAKYAAIAEKGMKK